MYVGLHVHVHVHYVRYDNDNAQRSDNAHATVLHQDFYVNYIHVHVGPLLGARVSPLI